MDVKCPKCGEYWDVEEFHYYAEEVECSFDDVYRSFRSIGCGETFSEWNVARCHRKMSAGQSYEALADLLGDDVDGYASMVEDLESLL